MRIVNVVGGLDPIGFGVWNAAIAQSKCLSDSFATKSELWTSSANPDLDQDKYALSQVRTVGPPNISDCKSLLMKSGHSKKDTIFVTHGSWAAATRWGRKASMLGFKWVYVPQGMLEPWSLTQKKLKKRLYAYFIEYPLVRRATAIRAVSSPEQDNLRRIFPQQSIFLAPNSIETSKVPTKRIGLDTGVKQFLFLGRLHKKKGVAELVEAFATSQLANNESSRLLVVGPDQGERTAVKTIVRNYKCENVELLGALFGPEKDEILHQSQFYVLPSHSEGFPSSVLEAMNANCLPIISDGCNFPEAFNCDAAMRIEVKVASIRNGLEQAAKLTPASYEHYLDQARHLLDTHYSQHAVSNRIHSKFAELLSSNTVANQRPC